jgi:hypothetical protein
VTPNYLTRQVSDLRIGEQQMIQIKRVIEESMPNDRLYFTRSKICEVVERGLAGDAAEHSSFMDALLAIPGVMLAMVGPYSVIISRNPMFEWAEIEGPLLKLLSSFSIDDVKFADGSQELIKKG